MTVIQRKYWIYKVLKNGVVIASLSRNYVGQECDMCHSLTCVDKREHSKPLLCRNCALLLINVEEDDDEFIGDL